MEKRLYRSRVNRVVAGICGGIAEYFRIDPVIIRIATVLLTLITGGTGILVYIIAIFIIPDEKNEFGQDFGSSTKSGFNNSTGGFNNSTDGFNSPTGGFDDDFGSPVNETRSTSRFDSDKSKVVIGACLILFGVLFFVKQAFHWFDMRYFWPIVLIVVGLIFIYKNRRNSI